MFCDDINKSRLGLFLTAIDHDIPNLLCSQLKVLEPTEKLFNPYEENSQFLQDWLTYRNVSFRLHQSENSLAQLTVENFKTDGNYPPFIGFKFKAKDASTSFLILWLSWFGITSSKSVTREWWESKVKVIQELLTFLENSKPQKKSKLTFKDSFAELAVLHQQRQKLDEIIEDVGYWLNDLPEDDFVVLLKETTPNIENVVDGNSKAILAFALNASVILVPLVVTNLKFRLSKEVEEKKAVQAVTTELEQRLINKDWQSRLASVLGGQGVYEIAKKLNISNPAFVRSVSTGWIQDFLSKSRIPKSTITSLILYHLFPRQISMAETFVSQLILPALFDVVEAALTQPPTTPEAPKI